VPGRAVKFTTDEPRTGVAEDDGPLGLGRLRFSVAPTVVRGRAAVRFALARATAVKLAVYDMTGRQVRELAAQTLPAGTHAFGWDGRDDSGRKLAQGVYVVRLDAGGEKLGVKAVLLQ
jgi:flagellar basal-body rod modification protein FlgD